MKDSKAKKKQVTIFVDTNTLNYLDEVANRLGSGSKSQAIRFLAKQEHDKYKQQQDKQSL